MYICETITKIYATDLDFLDSSWFYPYVEGKEIKSFCIGRAQCEFGEGALEWIFVQEPHMRRSGLLSIAQNGRGGNHKFLYP